MKQIIQIIPFCILLFSTRESGAQLNPIQDKWLSKYINPIHSLTDITKTEDLSFLRKELKGVRVLLKTIAGFLTMRSLNKTNKESHWLFENNKVYELEAGREHDIIPAIRHDGIIIVKQSSLPTYIWK